jgi:hypothetical protein
MSDLVDNTNEVKPMSYSDKLVKEFEQLNQEQFSLAQVEMVIRNFSQAEYENKRKISDTFTWGKYRYKSTAEVVNFDRKYCEWVLKQSVMESYPELRASIEKELKKKH